MRNLIIALVLMGGTNLAAAGPTVDRSPPILPDSIKTPGVFDSTATVETICKKGYTATVRHVTDKQKNEVFAEYGLERSGSYEVDHLISLELGGSNDTRNLWPQSYYGMWGARVKDTLENRLHTLVCDGKMSLREAQLEISTNWIETYCKYIPSDDCRGINE
ncbi:HNH endonuclease [bacterium]|nr:HNH endonuclease [bacterium]